MDIIGANDNKLNQMESSSKLIIDYFTDLWREVSTYYESHERKEIQELVKFLKSSSIADLNPDTDTEVIRGVLLVVYYSLQEEQEESILEHFLEQFYLGEHEVDVEDNELNDLYQSLYGEISMSLYEMRLFNEILGWSISFPFREWDENLC